MNAISQPQLPVHTNGVNVTEMFEIIEAVKQDKELAKFRFRAKNRWADGSVNHTSIQGFYGSKTEDKTRAEAFVLMADEPRMLLGTDRAVNPAEYLLHALVSCLTTSTIYHAAARGIEIEAIDSELEGDIDVRGFLGLSDDVRKGYQSIRVSMRVKTAASVETLHELAAYSPMYDVVSKSLPVALTIRTY
ncbi:MAG TPA: OsmC family protein [Burkholderiales bacterium]|nr:OsmC family protein [Burkholderiales bacterium]